MRRARPAHTPLHRRRPKETLEAATQPDLQAPPADHREHRPRLAMFLPVNLHRTAVELTGEDYDGSGWEGKEIVKDFD